MAEEIKRRRGGQPGNNNGSKNKDFERALRFALDNYKDGRVARSMALREIGFGVVKRALEGDEFSIQMIADRIDGKPHVAATVEGGWTVVIQRDDVGL